MPDPDIPPIVLSEEYIAKIKAEMPVMPPEWRQRLVNLGVDRRTVELMIENQADSPEYKYLEFIELNLADTDFAKWITNAFVNIIEPLRIASKKFVKHEWADTLPTIYKLIQTGKLSSSRAKDLMNDIFTSVSKPDSIEEFATQKGYIQVSDEGEITKIVTQVLADNKQAAEDVINGEMKAIGFLVGQVMKLSQGKANPSLAQKLIKKQLNIWN